MAITVEFTCPDGKVLATVHRREWTCDHPRILAMLRAASRNCDIGGHTPYPDRSLADFAIERLPLMGRIIHADKNPCVEKGVFMSSQPAPPDEDDDEDEDDTEEEAPKAPRSRP